ncbi:MAG: exodeoxyribonuclease III [Candidatus Limnocylindrus sp.]
MGAQGITITSWNVNGIRARAERLAAFIERSSSDVLLLQETKCNPEQVPADLFNAHGYQWAAIGAGGRNGVLIASRIGLDAPLLGLPASAVAAASAAASDDPDLCGEPRLIAARCGGIQIASVYVPNGREVGTGYWRAKLRWMQALAHWSRDALSTGPLILGGDFNVAPRDEDVWDMAALAGATHVSREERDAFQEILDAGLADTAVECVAPGETRAFTWWDYRGGAFHRGHGMRIDHLLASPSAGKPLAFRVDRDERKGALPSDHAPITLTIEAL